MSRFIAPPLQSWRGWLLLAISMIAIATLIAHGPIAQDPAYHRFADQRTLLGIANFWNVATNLPFLLVGGYGLALVVQSLRNGGLPPSARPAYAVMFVGLMLIAPASAWYHLEPANATLLWDRLPMTLVFMALFAAILGEHVDPALPRRGLPVLLTIGLASVLWWHATGDLRPYAIVQFLPMLLLPLILLLYRSGLPAVGLLWAMLAVYGLAKVCEVFDAPIHAALGFSGHSLKHLAAAFAAWLIALRVGRCIAVSRPT